MHAEKGAAAMAEALAYIDRNRDMLNKYEDVLKNKIFRAFAAALPQIGRKNSLFLPTEAIVSYLCDTTPPKAEKEYPFAPDYSPMERKAVVYLPFAEDAMLYTWKLAKNVYQIDSDALTAILASPVPDKLCALQLLDRFREYCIYISFDWRHGSDLKFNPLDNTFVKGMFVHLDGILDPSYGRVGLNFSLDLGPLIRGYPMGMTVGFVSDLSRGVGWMLDWQAKTFQENDSNLFDDGPGSNAPLLREQVIKIVAYILADNHDVRLNGAEIDWTDRDSMRPKAKKVKGGYKFFPLNKSNFYTVGERLGAEVRARLAQGAAPEAVKGHFTSVVAPFMRAGEDALVFKLD